MGLNMNTKIREIVDILIKKAVKEGENAAANYFDAIIDEKKIPLWGRIAIQQEFKKQFKKL